MIARRHIISGLVGVVAAVAGYSSPAFAADDEVPYWASIDATIANMRVGPADSYKIDWVYKREHLPVKVIRREGPWRLIVDPDGAQGWMRDLLLSRERTALVTGTAEADIRSERSASSRLLWKVEPGVVGSLKACEAGWCEFDAAGHHGYISEDRIWGDGAP